MTRSSDAYVTHRKAGGRFAPASITAPPLVPGTGSLQPLGSAATGYGNHPRRGARTAVCVSRNYLRNNTEASVVRDVHESYTVKHLSIGVIMRMLNERGVPTRTGRSHLKR